MKRGVVIGKFYPPHRGHKYLIDTAVENSDAVTVIVCDHRSQTISAEQRADWLRTIHPSANVIVVPDTLGEDDSEAWASFTVQVLGYKPELVFTSEPYGDAYAECMGARHVLVDRARTRVPISATEVRTNPLAAWEYLEPCVWGYFARRVAVVGAESTGTTTIAQALASHYKTAWVPEFGRYYTEAKVTGESAWRTEEFIVIARIQNAWEDAMAEESNRILLCDTDSFATAIWHERYMGAASTEVEELSRDRAYALTFLTDVDIPFVQDGLRDGEHIRRDMHERFVKALQERGRHFVVLSGSHEERLARAIALCDEILATPAPI